MSHYLIPIHHLIYMFLRLDCCRLLQKKRPFHANMQKERVDFVTLEIYNLVHGIFHHSKSEPLREHSHHLLSSSMEATFLLTEQDIMKEVPVTLVSPRHPMPAEIVFLSNIDQTVAFPVETVFFYEAPSGDATLTSDIIDRVQRSVSEVLLIHYYFMAGRLNFNLETRRLELVCNNAGVLFVGAQSNRRLKELGNLSLPNPSFHHLILRTEGFKSLADTPIFTVQVCFLTFMSKLRFLNR